MMKPVFLTLSLVLAGVLSFGCTGPQPSAYPQPDLMFDLWPDGAPTDNGPTAEQLAYYSNEKQVGPDTPPAFIMANSDDDLVPCENSLRYYEALRANGVPAALHVYPTGGHGWADHLDFPYRAAWMQDLRIWLEQINQ